MAAKKAKQDDDPSTEDRIKNAARTVFHKKGFAATRTRDIAEQADINLALLNYYFRSKQKLFDLIMLETMQGFLSSMAPMLNDANTTLEDKIKTFASTYIDLLKQEPEIPFFIISEIRNNHKTFAMKLNIKEIIIKSELAKQYQQTIAERNTSPQHILHLIMNVVGMTVFPFIGRPMLQIIGDMTDKNFNKLMDERKKLIPVWIKAILKA